jgi:hypothetical protein
MSTLVTALNSMVWSKHSKLPELTKAVAKRIRVACAELAQWGRPWCSYRTPFGYRVQEAGGGAVLKLKSWPWEETKNETERYASAAPS